MHYIAQSLLAIDDRSAFLSWDPVIDSDMDGYNVYMAVGSPVGFKRVNGPLLTVPEYLTVPLRNDQIYYFKVSSVDTSGNESELSDYIEFRLSDYKADPKLRIVVPPHKIRLFAGVKDERAPLYDNFLTRYEWVDGYLTGRMDVTIVANKTLVKTVPPNFTTLFTLGG